MTVEDRRQAVQKKISDSNRGVREWLSAALRHGIATQQILQSPPGQRKARIWNASLAGTALSGTFDWWASSWVIRVSE